MHEDCTFDCLDSGFVPSNFAHTLNPSFTHCFRDVWPTQVFDRDNPELKRPFRINFMSHGTFDCNNSNTVLMQ